MSSKLCFQYSWQLEMSGASHFTPGESPWYPLGRRLVGPQSQSGCCREERILDPTGTLIPIPRPIAGRYSWHNFAVCLFHTCTFYVAGLEIPNCHVVPKLRSRFRNSGHSIIPWACAYFYTCFPDVSFMLMFILLWAILYSVAVGFLEMSW
jgi:hypothetical protein